MITTSVPSDLYSGCGWAVCAIVGDDVIAMTYVDHPDAVDLSPIVAALDGSAVVAAAKAAAEAAYEKAEALAADPAAESEDIEAAEAAADKLAVKIRGGMMSATAFCHTFSARERAQAGVKNAWI